MFQYVLCGLISFFTDLENSHEKHCLTIDCSYKNKNRPGQYSSAADNLDE